MTEVKREMKEKEKSMNQTKQMCIRDRIRTAHAVRLWRSFTAHIRINKFDKRAG